MLLSCFVIPASISLRAHMRPHGRVITAPSCSPSGGVVA
jgi:hypothetical protein